MIEAPLQARHDRIIVQPINATEQRNDTRKQHAIHPTHLLPGADGADGEDSIELSKAAAYMSVLLVNVCVQMR